MRKFSVALFRAGARIALCAFAVLQAATATSATVTTVNPRPFGYVIGDRIEQRIVADAPAGFELVADTLPKAGRADIWLERQAPRLTTRHAGNGTRYEIALDYQIVNVPEQIRTIALPAIRVQFRSDGKTVEEAVAEWPITVAPITPEHVLSRAGLEEMRPDRAPLLIDTRGFALRISLYAAALAAVGGYYAFAWLGVPFLPRTRGPFARAARDLRRLVRTPRDRTAYRSALQRLHRAFDETAGRTVFAEQLERFFAEHPQLAGIRADAQQFFCDSQQEFFASGTGPGSLDELLVFARRCRDAERSAA